jgi:hypothetical protein
MKLCLKFIRQKNYHDIFDSLLEKSNCKFEDPLLTKFHKEFVQIFLKLIIKVG